MKVMVCLAVMFVLCSCSTRGTAQSEIVITPVAVNTTEIEIPKRIESFAVLKLGLSSTGSIKAIGRYRLTRDCNLGKKSDEIIHLVQQDLFGGRLFWSCLVNESGSKVQVLYRCQEPDAFGTIMTMDKEDSYQAKCMIFIATRQNHDL
jgi:hypothetical protein